MSHSYHGEKQNFHFNSDFSGDVRIIDKETGAELLVPGDDILKLVARYYVEPQKIAQLEQATVDELLLGVSHCASRKRN